MEDQVLLYEDYIPVLPELIPLNRKYIRLLYIGPYLSERAETLQGVRKLSDFSELLRRRGDETIRQRRVKNVKIFKILFENARPNECVGEMGATVPNRRYAARPYNKMGWNTLVYYLYKKIEAGRMPLLSHEVLPDFQVHERPNREAYPRRCS